MSRGEKIKNFFKSKGLEESRCDISVRNAYMKATLKYNKDDLGIPKFLTLLTKRYINDVDAHKLMNDMYSNLDWRRTIPRSGKKFTDLNLEEKIRFVSSNSIENVLFRNYYVLFLLCSSSHRADVTLGLGKIGSKKLPTDIKNVVKGYVAVGSGIRRHKGIVQSGGKRGKLRKGYKYTGKRLRNGLAEIVKV